MCLSPAVYSEEREDELRSRGGSADPFSDKLPEVWVYYVGLRCKLEVTPMVVFFLPLNLF
jgi:hypothetical protein